MPLFRCGGGGGAKVKTGTFQTSTSGTVTVNCGFKPKYLALEGDGSTSSAGHFMNVYNEDTSNTYSYYASASAYPTKKNNGASSNGSITITSTGFTYYFGVSPARTVRYFAIG